MKTKNILFCSTLITILFLNSLCAQWPSTVEDNLEINNSANFPFLAVEDQKGGAYLLYGQEDYFSDKPINSLWFMRLDKYGKTILDPVKIGPDSTYLNADRLLWTSDGNLIFGLINNGFKYWDENRAVFSTKLYIQKLDTLGNSLWGDGAAVINDTLENSNFDLLADSDGGCFVSTVAVNKQTRPNYSGYKAVQRMDVNGNREWSDSGSVIYTGDFNQNDWAQQYKIYYNSLSENLFVVHEYKRGIHEKIQSLDASGSINWTLPAREEFLFSDAILADDNELYILYHKQRSDFFSYEFSFDKISNQGVFLSESPIVFVDSCGHFSKIFGSFITDAKKLNILWFDQNDSQIIGAYLQSVDDENNIIYPDRFNSLIDPGYFPIRVLIHNEDLLILADNIQNQIVQKITFDNEKPWSLSGKTISSDLDLCFSFPHLLTDNYGGALILWLECLQGIRGKQISKFGQLGVLTDLKKDNVLYEDYYVSNAYPNPFNPSTTITYHVNTDSKVNISLLNSIGEVVYNEKYSFLKSGMYKHSFYGQELSSGVYYVQFTFKGNRFPTSKTRIITRKILLLK